MLAAHEVHVWYGLEAGLPERFDRTGALALLSQGERDRYDRFLFDRNKLEFLLAHVLVRKTLSRYHPAIAPQEWEFSQNAYGRPSIANRAAPEDLHFNLSHSGGISACAVSGNPECGVDVEAVDRRVQLLSVAEGSFSAAEFEALRQLPSSEQRRRFFEYWTLKESYIKARGMGLALPLDQFTFLLQQNIRVEFEARLNDRAEDWTFQLMTPSAGFQAAVAIRHPGPIQVSEFFFVF